MLPVTEVSHSRYMKWKMYLEALARIASLGVFVGVYYGKGQFTRECERKGWILIDDEGFITPA
jgi:hypothetical protein